MYKANEKKYQFESEITIWKRMIEHSIKNARKLQIHQTSYSTV